MIAYLDCIVNGLKIPMTIFGFTFSFWDIMWFSAIASILIRFIGKVIYG